MPLRAARDRSTGFEPAFAASTWAAVALSASALFFSRGFDDNSLVWIGGAALVLAAIVAAAWLLRIFPAPRLDLPASAFVGSLFGLAAWAGLSTLWSLSPDRSWAYTNRSLVYAAFALLGVLLSAVLPRMSTVAGAVAVLLGLLLGWALLAKCVPALYPDYGRVARLRAPVGYWNELALLCAVTVPIGLWVATGRGHRPAIRSAGALLLFAATVTQLLTYSRVGVVLVCLAAAVWTVLERDRLESLAATALAGGVGAAVFGVALSLPGITSDGQPRSVRVHDGWIFAGVLLVGAATVFACAVALARIEARSPFPPERRRRIERAAAFAAIGVVVVGIVASVVFADRIWSEFTNPVSKQISSTKGRYVSLNSSNRWRWWGEEWHAFAAHPGGGTGAGTFELTDRAQRRSPLVTTEPHNTPLQFLGELGVVGFLFYVAAVAAATIAIVRARRRAEGTERAAVTAAAIGLAAFAVHTIFDMDWNYVATCGPLLLLAGVLVARPTVPVPAARRAPRRVLLSAAAVLFALAACYSLAAPWLARRELATATTASAAKSAHGLDPLSTTALIDWAAFEDAGGNVLKANDLYHQAVSLEPRSPETWYALGLFLFEHRAWRPAYDALSQAWRYDRYGPAGRPCGSLDQARHKALGTWPPSCPRGRPRASSP